MKIDRGIFAAMAAAALFGLSTPLAKMLLNTVPALLLAGLLYLGSGAGLAAILAVRAAAGAGHGIRWPRGADAGWLIGAIVAGGAIGPYLLMLGLRDIDSASASLILNLEGVFTSLIAWLVFKENVGRRIALGMGLIVAGGAALSIGAGFRALAFFGPLAIAGACLAWAIDNNLTRKVSSHDAMAIACAKGLAAGATNVALGLAGGAALPAATTLMKAGLIGFTGYGLSLTLFVVALRSLGSARTGAYFSTAPFIGAALAVVLGAPLTAALGLAGFLMAAGVWLHLTERHEHLHQHEALEHEHPHVHDEHHRHAHGPGWDGREPHTHVHVHEPLRHSHAHFPDLHHRHPH